MTRSDLARRTVQVAMLVYICPGLAHSQPRPAAPATFSLPKAGIQFSLPAGWRMIKGDYSGPEPLLSPPFPASGEARYAAGDRELVLAYLLFDPRYENAQRQRYSERSRALRRHKVAHRIRPDGTELLESELERTSYKQTVVHVHDLLVWKGRVECEITFRVIGNRKRVDKEVRAMAPVLTMVAKTIVMKGPGADAERTR